MTNSRKSSLLLALVGLCFGAGIGLLACSKNQGESGAVASSTANITTPTSGSADAASNRHDTRGVIKAFAEGRKSVNIAHEEIPGFMKAMTMPFNASSPSVLAGLNVGDAVDVTFVEENDGAFTIVTIKKR